MADGAKSQRDSWSLPDTCAHRLPQVGIPEKKCVPRADLLSEPDGGRTGLGKGLRGLSLASQAPEESREHPTLNFPGAHREERGLWPEQPSPSGQREDGLPSPDRR